VAVVLWLADALAYIEFAAQLALRPHAPVPLVMVTVDPLTEHAPEAVIVGGTPELLVVVIVKEEPKAAEDGAPVNVTVGWRRIPAVRCIADAAWKLPSAGHVAVRTHVPE
jgi:hypothetical protein